MTFYRLPHNLSNINHFIRNAGLNSIQIAEKRRPSIQNYSVCQT